MSALTIRYRQSIYRAKTRRRKTDQSELHAVVAEGSAVQVSIGEGHTDRCQHSPRTVKPERVAEIEAQHRLSRGIKLQHCSDVERKVREARSGERQIKAVVDAAVAQKAGPRLHEEPGPLHSPTRFGAETSLQDLASSLSVADVRVAVEVVHRRIESQPAIEVVRHATTETGIVSQIERIEVRHARGLRAPHT
jgi:hypothetical protein